MNKFLIIMSHTYKNRIKSRSFIVTSIISVLLILVLTNIQTIIETFKGEEENKVLVLTENEVWFKQLEESLMANDELLFTHFDEDLSEAKQQVEDEEAQSIVSLEENNEGFPQATYYSNQIANTTNSESIRQAVQQLKVSIATEQADISTEVLQQISTPVTFDLIALEENAKSAEELNQTRGIVYIMLFLMYFSVMMYGNMIATEVATEKSSRVMEILISSVSPVSQMFAKILGIALLGITQFALFITVGYFGIQQSQKNSDGSLLASFGLTNVEPATILYAALFFVLGYLLYATLAATLGSLVSRLEDAQQIVSPMLMLVVVGFILAVFGLAAPDASYITVTSFIPFFTPLLMFLRVGMLDVPLWEVILSIGILVGSIVLLGMIGARVYRGGVLMYGKSSSLKDIKKAIQLSKREG